MAAECSTPLRIVILGGGMIAEVHRRAALLAGAQLVGVMASTPDRSRAVADKWHTGAIVSLADLADLRPDIVHVCSPNALHSEHVEAALAAGAHVICEKPLSTHVAEAGRLATLADNAGKVATVPFVYRFHPLIRELRARVQRGDFGRWQLLHGSYLQDWMLSPLATSWRVDPALGGASRAFADIGSHWCDLMEFVTGERIAAVSAAITITVPERPTASGATFGGNSHGELKPVETEDAATVMFKTVSGVVGSMLVSQVSAGRKNRLWFEFDGANQSAVFDQEQPETVWLGSPHNAEIVQRDPSVNLPDAARLSSLPPGHPQGYAQCFEHFIADTYQVARGRHVDGLPTFADGARSAAIVDAVVRSAQSGQWVAVC